MLLLAVTNRYSHEVTGKSWVVADQPGSSCLCAQDCQEAAQADLYPASVAREGLTPLCGVLQG